MQGWAGLDAGRVRGACEAWGPGSDGAAKLAGPCGPKPSRGHSHAFAPEFGVLDSGRGSPGERGSGAVVHSSGRGSHLPWGFTPGTRRDGLWRPSPCPGPCRADEDGFLQEEALGRGRKEAGRWWSRGRERGAPWNPCGTF